MLFTTGGIYHVISLFLHHNRMKLTDINNINNIRVGRCNEVFFLDLFKFLINNITNMTCIIDSRIEVSYCEASSVSNNANIIYT